MLMLELALVEADIEGVVVIREIGSIGSSNRQSPMVSSLLTGANGPFPESLRPLDR